MASHESMQEYVFFLGSHPRLSELEIQKVFGGACTLEVRGDPLPLCVAKCKSEIPDTVFDRLGGVERVSKVLGAQQGSWNAKQLLTKLSPPPSKWMVGLGSPDPRVDLDSLAFQLKTAAQEHGSKLKFVLPKEKTSMLNAAQVIFNRLDQRQNAEIVLLPTSAGWYALKTIWIQDIQAYEIRDTSRPARSGEVGMLPPKLAQIMINVAVGEATNITIWDPFCGMGTVIQEGQLMGQKMIGSDIRPDMVEATQKNLAWLAEHFDVSADPVPRVFLHDAREAPLEDMQELVDAIVTEPYLGPPQRSALPHPAMKKLKAELTSLYVQAFRQFRPTLRKGGQVLFLMPAYAKASAGKPARHNREFTFISEGMLDAIAKLGYRRLHPFGKGQRLLYARPDAWVGRELTLWEKQ